MDNLFDINTGAAVDFGGAPQAGAARPQQGRARPSSMARSETSSCSCVDRAHKTKMMAGALAIGLVGWVAARSRYKR